MFRPENIRARPGNTTLQALALENVCNSWVDNALKSIDEVMTH